MELEGYFISLKNQSVFSVSIGAQIFYASKIFTRKFYQHSRNYHDVRWSDFWWAIEVSYRII